MIDVADCDYGRARGENFAHVGRFHEHDAAHRRQCDSIGKLRIHDGHLRARPLDFGAPSGDLLLAPPQFERVCFPHPQGRARPRHLAGGGIDLLLARAGRYRRIPLRACFSIASALSNRLRNWSGGKSKYRRSCAALR
jgi:hypothetical protein